VKARACHFDRHFIKDLEWWIETKREIALKMLDLVDAVLREPERGIGKPERLKSLGAGVWSRRITQEHRLVYQLFDDRIVFLQGRYHYEK
jgi:toxin YoeB